MIQAEVLIHKIRATTRRMALNQSKLNFQLIVISHSLNRTLIDAIRNMRVTRTYLKNVKLDSNAGFDMSKHKSIKSHGMLLMASMANQVLR